MRSMFHCVDLSGRFQNRQTHTRRALNIVRAKVNLHLSFSSSMLLNRLQHRLCRRSLPHCLRIHTHITSHHTRTPSSSSRCTSLSSDRSTRKMEGSARRWDCSVRAFAAAVCTEKDERGREVERGSADSEHTVAYHRDDILHPCMNQWRTSTSRNRITCATSSDKETREAGGREGGGRQTNRRSATNNTST